jgi:hypothetical protein
VLDERYLMGWDGRSLRCAVMVLCFALLYYLVSFSASSCLFFAMASVLGDC